MDGGGLVTSEVRGGTSGPRFSAAVGPAWFGIRSTAATRSLPHREQRIRVHLPREAAPHLIPPASQRERDAPQVQQRIRQPSEAFRTLCADVGGSSHLIIRWIVLMMLTFYPFTSAHYSQN